MDSFKNWAVSQGSVGTPIGTYVGECVSLIQQYLSRVYGIPFQARGHAKDWANNGNVLSYFDKVSSPQAGDIGVSGATASNPYGHIWIYLTPNLILEQNGKIARRVSTGSSYLKPIAILRRKGTQGGDMPITKEQEQVVAILATGSLPGKDYNYPFVGTSNVDGMLNFWRSQPDEVARLADLRLQWLNAVGDKVSVKAPVDGNNINQILANVGNLYKLIDEKDKEIDELKKQTKGDFEEVGNNSGLFQRKKK